MFFSFIERLNMENKLFFPWKKLEPRKCLNPPPSLIPLSSPVALFHLGPVTQIVRAREGGFSACWGSPPNRTEPLGDVRTEQGFLVFHSVALAAPNAAAAAGGTTPPFSCLFLRNKTRPYSIAFLPLVPKKNLISINLTKWNGSKHKCSKIV